MAVTALTNAERQARHRGRQQQKLATVTRNADETREGAAAEVFDLLRQHYRNGAASLAHQDRGDNDAVDEVTQAAIGAFNGDAPLSVDAILHVMEDAGRKRWVDLFQKAALDWKAKVDGEVAAGLRTRWVDPPAAPRRKGRAKTDRAAHEAA